MGSLWLRAIYWLFSHRWALIHCVLALLLVLVHCAALHQTLEPPKQVPPSTSTVGSHAGHSSWLRRLTHSPCLKRLRQFARRWILLGTLVLQVLNYIMLFLIGGGDEFAVRDRSTKHGKKSYVDWFVARPEIFSLILQLLNAVIVIFVAFKYVRKTHMVDVKFLIRSFVATTLAFAGIHVTIFLLDDARAAYWVPCKITDEYRCQLPKGQSPDIEFWGIVTDFVYFSLSTNSSMAVLPALMTGNANCSYGYLCEAPPDEPSQDKRKQGASAEAVDREYVLIG